MNIGRVVGSLKLLKPLGYVKFGVMTRLWLCECLKCGRTEEIPQAAIKRRQAGCSVCRRGKCVVCGGEIVKDWKRNTCSDACHQQKNRDTQNLFYAKRVANDPDVNRKAKAKRKARAATDQALSEHLKSLERAAHFRKAANPEYRKKRQVYQAERWGKYKSEIKAQRDRFWKSLSVEEQETRRDAAREAGRAWTQRFYQWLRDNPVEHQQYIERQRAYRVEANRQRELATLQKAMTEINKYE